MDERKQRAYCLLVESIAHYAFRQATVYAEDVDLSEQVENADSKTRGPIFHHYSESSGEEVADDLMRLRVVKEVTPSNYEFNCPLPDVISVVRTNLQFGRSFDAVLRTFIMVYYQWGTDYWGFGGEPHLPFSPRIQLVPLLDALVGAGDAISVGRQYKWSERVLPLVKCGGYSATWPQE